MSANEKKIVKLIWICFVLLSVPMIVIAFYSHPSVDDYRFGIDVHSWVTNHGYNVFGILKCAALFSYRFYFEFAGSYADSFTGALMPETFGCYWISAVIIYVLLTGGLVWFFRTLVSGLAGKEYKGIGTACALLCTVAVTQNWPSAVEALYWFDGAQAYMGYHALYIWLCGVTIHYFFSEDKRKSIRDVVIAAVLAFVVAGGNNVTSFMSILTFCVFLGISVLLRKKWGVIVPLIVSVIGFLISFLSPGTTIRGGDSSNYTPILITILKCFRWTIRQYLLGWTTLGIGLMLLFLTPFLIRVMKKTADRYQFRFPFPLLIAVGGCCFLSAMSSPAFYVLGESGPLRLRNVVYVTFVVVLVMVYAYFCGWLAANKLSEAQAEGFSGIYQNMSLRYSVPLLLLVIVWLSAGTPEKYGTSLEAVKELANGTIRQYHAELMERQQLYEDESVTEVVVEPLSVKPELLFFDDVTDDETNWKNLRTAQYFGKKSVKLSVYDPDIDYD